MKKRIQMAEAIFPGCFIRCATENVSAYYYFWSVVYIVGGFLGIL